jgi:hypothetical protein
MSAQDEDCHHLVEARAAGVVTGVGGLAREPAQQRLARALGDDDDRVAARGDALAHELEQPALA